MNDPKILIDTNILIGLEDNREIDAAFSSLLQKCQSNSVQIWVHEASRKDIERDKNDPRKAIILSKIGKFPELTGIPIPDQATLEATYGQITRPNDHVDVILLHTLHEVGAVDFLVTQDRGIHKRASQLGISNRVFKVEDALVWLRDKYDRIAVPLPFIEETQCHKINRKDDIFTSLQSDYVGFSDWFNNSCIRNHRHCWTISLDNEIAGIAIRKDESLTDLLAVAPSARDTLQGVPKKILKICTFKIKEKHRGEKFGEQLLKQILWWGHKNGYDLVYLTVYPKHKSLVDLLVQYGFEGIGRASGELYLAKTYAPGVLKSDSPSDALLYHRQYYPAFLGTEPVQKFLIPIKADYYAALFPENVRKRQSGLFDEVGIQGSKIPGNTIRKVYVCHAQASTIKLGDILLFFHLKDNNSFDSQRLITVGIVDGFEITDKNDELLRLTAKRSVFSDAQLQGFTKNQTKKVKVINFLLAGHIAPSISYDKMEGFGILGPYQSIRKIEHVLYKQLEPEIRLHV
jgi:GNAT superfamily N-acetyltransferase/rRNA-processing protein FCF1